MAIYIATIKEMPTIPYNESNRCFNTQNITKKEQIITNIFSLPFVKYLGSDEGCGCGFRHALLEDHKWFEVIDENENEIDNSNHQNLVDFVAKNNENESKVEILSCWDGDFNEHIEYRSKIKLTDILDSNFYFKERGFYTVEL